MGLDNRVYTNSGFVAHSYTKERYEEIFGKKWDGGGHGTDERAARDKRPEPDPAPVPAYRGRGRVCVDSFGNLDR